MWKLFKKCFGKQRVQACNMTAVFLKSSIEVQGILGKPACVALLQDVLTALADETTDDNGDGVYARLRVDNRPLSDYVANRLQTTLPGCTVNSKWFYTKYNTGGCIEPHVDGHVFSDGRKSIATVLLYLTDGFVGGDTQIYDDDETIKLVKPIAGNALLLPPTVLHAGTDVTSGGPKVIARSDIFLVSPRAHPRRSRRWRAAGHLLHLLP